MGSKRDLTVRNVHNSRSNGQNAKDGPCRLEECSWHLLRGRELEEWSAARTRVEGVLGENQRTSVAPLHCRRRLSRTLRLSRAASVLQPRGYTSEAPSTALKKFWDTGAIHYTISSVCAAHPLPLPLPSI